MTYLTGKRPSDTDRRYDNEQGGLMPLQREILSYPEPEHQWLNEARNPKSEFYEEGRQLGEWRSLPATARL